VRLGVLAWKWCWAVPVHVGIVTAHTGHECAIWRIVEILGLLAHTVHAVILETALDAAITWSLVAYGSCQSDPPSHIPAML
jgi:hypothetical protein